MKGIPHLLSFSGKEAVEAVRSSKDANCNCVAKTIWVMCANINIKQRHTTGKNNKKGGGGAKKHETLQRVDLHVFSLQLK